MNAFVSQPQMPRNELWDWVSPRRIARQGGELPYAQGRRQEAIVFPS